MISNNVLKVCVKCESNETGKNGRGDPDWRIINHEYWCTRCWKKNIYNPVYNQTKRNRDPYTKTLMFKKRKIHLDKNPRKGQCEECGIKVGDEYIDYYGKKRILKRTNTHHIEYHEDDPLKDTKELCIKCHIKAHKKYK